MSSRQRRTSVSAPFDFLSIHTYNDSEMAAAKLIRAKEVALEIDSEYFETLAIVKAGGSASRITGYQPFD